MNASTITYYVDYTFYDPDTGYCNDYMKIEAHTKMEAYEIFTRDHAPSSLVDVDAIKTDEEVNEEVKSIIVTDEEKDNLDYAVKNHIEGLRDFAKSIYSGSDIKKAVADKIEILNTFRIKIGLTRV